MSATERAGVRRAAWATAAGLAIALAAAGCRPTGGAPAATLEAYGDALEGGDYERAYEMMSEEFRARHSQDDFVRMMKESPREVEETAARLGGSPREVEITADLRYGLGDRLRLVLEDGQWRIASNPIAYYAQSTPREALRSFVRAYELERWDVLLRFVPNEYRERMTVETVREQFQGPRKDAIATMMNILQANLDEPITEVRGNEARMPYGEKYEVQFVREDGLWKIKDLD